VRLLLIWMMAVCVVGTGTLVQSDAAPMANRVVVPGMIASMAKDMGADAAPRV
jgi:hypothetical protein